MVSLYAREILKSIFTHTAKNDFNKTTRRNIANEQISSMYIRALEVFSIYLKMQNYLVENQQEF